MAELVTMHMEQLPSHQGGSSHHSVLGKAGGNLVLLFRGLRLKAGVACGRLSPALCPASGRVDYRGKGVVREAGRLAGGAAAGQVRSSLGFVGFWVGGLGMGCSFDV